MESVLTTLSLITRSHLVEQGIGPLEYPPLGLQLLDYNMPRQRQGKNSRDSPASGSQQPLEVKQ